MKSLFQLDPGIIFLNHGSFGATPIPVMRAYQEWQERLERQPVRFIVHELLDELKHARVRLGEYVHADPDDLVYIPNATFGVNMIARSLDLHEGDEVLMTNHEYGACMNIWDFVACRKGFSIIKQPLPVPIDSPEEVIESIWQGVTSNTRCLFFSHITSPTAFHLPVEALCERARQAGIITIIDGAHGPGQVPLDLVDLGVDFYVGNCHKWMLSPKGAGFLFSRREVQHLVEPLVVSWGWGQNSPFTSGSRYLDHLEWWGTMDPSAYLAVPSAIDFQVEHDWSTVRDNCQKILAKACQRINELTGLDSTYSKRSRPFINMATVALPKGMSLPGFQEQLFQDYKIEVPCIQWEEEQFMRISIQAYNTEGEIDILVSALAELLPQHRLA